MENDYLTPEEVSDRLDISPDRLEEMRGEIDGPAYEIINESVIYPIAAVIAFETEEMFMKEPMRKNNLCLGFDQRTAKKSQTKKTNHRIFRK